MFKPYITADNYHSYIAQIFSYCYKLACISLYIYRPYMACLHHGGNCDIDEEIRKKFRN